ncbi:Rid family hydrolase [Nitratireductor arenosus]|uniref:Rid family hydrolase n=1 Tax=Nitratireductor arenosus TaxID=2682096 RepID=UPI003CCD877A
MGVGDVAAQTRQCIEIIKAAFEEAGSGLHDVVRTRVVLTDIYNWKTALDVRKEYFKDVRPVDTIMAVIVSSTRNGLSNSKPMRSSRARALAVRLEA